MTEAPTSRAVLTGDIGCQRFERRSPRAAMTRKLALLCTRLDETPSTEGRWEPYPYAPKRRYRVTARKLWVVGSYARGALTCGDLDVVIDGDADRLTEAGEVDRREGEFASEYARALCGGVPDVRLYVGTPQDNSSRSIQADAVLIWDAPGCAWRARIAAIKENEAATRHPRKADAIPLRMEQFDHRYVNGDLLVDLRDEGLFEWRFMPIAKADFDPLPQDGFDATVATTMGRVWHDRDVKVREMLPAIVRVLAAERPYWDSAPVCYSWESLNVAGAELRVGRPYLSSSDFSDMPVGRESLVLIPKFTTRGPNGAWLISRGPEHPDVKALQSRTTYALAGADERPYVAPAVAGKRQLGAQLAVFLFTSEAAAQRELKRLRASRTAALRPSRVVALRGFAVLHWMCAASVAVINGSVLTLRQSDLLGSHRSSNEEIFQALDLQRANDPRLDVEERDREALLADDMAVGE